MLQQAVAFEIPSRPRPRPESVKVEMRPRSRIVVIGPVWRTPGLPPSQKADTQTLPRPCRCYEVKMLRFNYISYVGIFTYTTTGPCTFRLRLCNNKQLLDLKENIRKRRRETWKVVWKWPSVCHILDHSRPTGSFTAILARSKSPVGRVLSCSALSGAIKQNLVTRKGFRQNVLKCKRSTKYS